MARGRVEEATRVAEQCGVELPRRTPQPDEGVSRGPRALFSPEYLKPTLLFGAASFCSLSWCTG